jgi:bifunctional N-acetylglucosamine-1-phosphate-uridyltransferase/glucosamine-1-phosphate-acetyltransferase GlmU-like protein
MEIGNILSGLNNIKSDNIIKLFSDLIFKDITKIRNYNENETYYKNDMIYMYDDTIKKHQIYYAKENNIKGVFDKNKWELFNISNKIEFIQTIIEENEAKSDNDMNTIRKIRWGGLV